MRYRRFIVVSAVAAASACAQIAGLEDPSQLATSPVDATTGSDTTTVTDGGGSSTPETSSDAAVDARPDGSCASAIFCEDFDTDASIASWSRKASGTGAVSFVGDPVRSPPRAMRAANAGTGNAQLVRIVPITNAIVCEMSVRASSWAGEGYFFELGLDPADKAGFDYWWIDVGKLAGDAILLEYSWNGSETNSYATWNAPAANTWVRVGVEVRLRGGAPTARILFDGVERAVRNIAAPSSTTYSLALGIGTDKSSTADDFVIDDVVCSEL